MTSDNVVIKRLDEAKKICPEFGLNANFLWDIYNNDNDWSFVLKIDALHEAACQFVLQKVLRVEANVNENRITADNEELKNFTNALSLNGKVSIVTILKSLKFPSDHLKYIDAIRKIRNSYAHNITYVDKKIFDVISLHNEKEGLLRSISSVENYNPVEFYKIIIDDPNIIKFCILSETSRLLVLLKHAFIKDDKHENSSE